MDDLIIRGDVLALWDKYHYEIATKAIEFDKALRGIPSAEPKKGKWIKISPANIYECSVCHQNVMTEDIEAYLFCHHCGADMRESE